MTALTFKPRHVVSYRSGLEEGTGRWLAGLGIEVGYETPASVIRYVIPERIARYTPDFTLPSGIVIETKGIFDAADRKKHLLIREQFPEVDIRFVFSNPNARIGKKSVTTYAHWCDGKNPKKFVFKYAAAPTKAKAAAGASWIPMEWLDLPN